MSFANGRWVKDWIAPKPTTVAVAIVVVFALSLAAFLWDVDTPNVMMFDETWYVPTAQKWLAAGEMMHEEHPPLGKLMIALGMWLFGDNPFGWRVMSAGFGALAVSGTFLWAFALLRSVPQALWAAAVVFCSNVVFVQARIAMLDIFLMAFCTLALAFFTFSIKEPNRRRSLGSRPSNTSSVTTDPTEPLQEKHQPNTSLPADPTKPHSLICHEPGQRLYAPRAIRVASPRTRRTAGGTERRAP